MDDYSEILESSAESFASRREVEVLSAVALSKYDYHNLSKLASHKVNKVATIA